MTTEVLGTVLKRLGSFDPVRFQTDFDERLKLQKAVYLLDDGFKVDLGYPFEYYLRGPYSSALARDAFQLGPKVFQSLPVRKFKNPVAEKRFGDFEIFVRPHLNDATWLEAAATILWQWNHGVKDPDALCAAMAAKGKPIDRPYCMSVLGELHTQGLLT